MIWFGGVDVDRITGMIRSFVNWLLDLLYPDLGEDDGDGDGWL